MKIQITFTEEDIKELIISWAKERVWDVSEVTWLEEVDCEVRGKSPNQKLFVQIEVLEKE